MAPSQARGYLRGMNSNLSIALTELAIRAEALVQCGLGHAECYHPHDDEADRRAHAMLGAALNRAEFPRTSLTEAHEELASILADANHECPDCSRMRDA